ncbi:MAG: tetratricopeptide repeat protein [Chthoniobacterales bacterium]
MKSTRILFLLFLVFTFGLAAGIAIAAKALDPGTYRGKSKQDAGSALTALARQQAGKGSWENIAVGRVLYLSGNKGQGQAIFDAMLARKREGSDRMRVGRVYWEAKEWEKAKAMFTQALELEPKDAPWLAEIGAYYNLMGERAKAEELFERSFQRDSSEVWQTVNVAGSYLGVEPLR